MFVSPDDLEMLAIAGGALRRRADRLRALAITAGPQVSDPRAGLHGLGLLMLVTVYQAQWLRGARVVRLDPTRMAQGIMTGIGFLGAGVIIKEGLRSAAHDRGVDLDHGRDRHPRRHRLLLPRCRRDGADARHASVFRWIESRMPAKRIITSTCASRARANERGGCAWLVEQHGFSLANLELPARGRRSRQTQYDGAQIATPFARLALARTLEQNGPCSSTASRRWTEQNRGNMESTPIVRVSRESE